MNKKIIKKTTKKVVKKPVAKRVIKKQPTKTKQSLLKTTNPIITERLKQQVFPYIVEDLISALHSAKVGQSIRFGKLGSFKKTRRQGTFNGKDYDVNSYRFKAFSALKNN